MTPKKDLYYTESDLAIKKTRRPSWTEWSLDFNEACTNQSKNQWKLADRYIVGEDTFGEEAPQAVNPLKISLTKLMRYVWVARKFAPSRRRKELSFSHHEVLAALPHDLQDKWLAESVQKEYSVQELEDASADDRGVEPKGEASLLDLFDMLLTRITVVRGKIPRDFLEEIKLLDQADKNINLAIASLKNREVGDPAQIELEDAA
jgi:hypothetical protein